MAESARELIISAALSTRIKKFDEIELEGRRRRNNCAYFDGKSCCKFKLPSKNTLLASWVYDNHFIPHPVLCFICPYYSIKKEGGNENNKVTLDIIEFYSYYSSIKDKLEREVNILSSRVSDFILGGSILFRRRREEILIYLEDIKRKLEILKELIVFEQTLK
ncbi:MAG: hypothetical protein QXV69_04155 [Sulfolobaceae archaeon]